MFSIIWYQPKSISHDFLFTKLSERETVRRKQGEIILRTSLLTPCEYFDTSFEGQGNEGRTPLHVGDRHCPIRLLYSVSFSIEWILIYLDCKELNLEAVWGICRTFVRLEFVGKMCIYVERKGVEGGEKQKSSSSWDSRFPGWRFRMMDSVKKRGKSSSTRET